jgi:hypothetical protein
MTGKKGPSVGWWTMFALVALLLGSGTPSGARVCLAPETAIGGASIHHSCSDSEIWCPIGTQSSEW